VFSDPLDEYEGLTGVAGQTPTAGHAGHAGGEVAGGLGEADGGHVGSQAGGAGQLDEGDVVVDGSGVPAGMGEHLGGGGGVSAEKDEVS